MHSTEHLTGHLGKMQNPTMYSQTFPCSHLC